MLKKILIQIFLIIIIIIISTLFYFKYINKNNHSQKNKDEIFELEITKGNVINNISYESQDFEGRKYLIKSQKGMVNKNDPNIIEMETVYAEITLLDETLVTIVSDYAVYDNIKFDTKFSSNIKVIHLDHVIKSDDLVLFLKEINLKLLII